ncbi:MAG TPA: leishmanolysin-related zinc metalloendopeptidase [Gemmatales bacterium]|nr:leishmanolysin-related zinc metalloendopeptidase [Gemmatales bacterium]
MLRRTTHGARFARLLLESLEERLTPSWSSVPPSLIAPPASSTAVVQNSQGDATGNAGIATTEIDWYRFTALASGSATFQALTPSSNLDTVAALYSSTGIRLAYNDDITPGSNRDSRFTVNLNAGQTYYFGVTNYTRSAGGAYTWSIDGAGSGTTPTDDSYENNDTLSTASNLGTLTATSTINNLVMADSNDWYRFTLSTAGTTSSSVAISSTSTQGDLDLELYNSAGTRIGVSEGSTNNESLSLDGVSAGTYYVHVIGWQGAVTPNYSMVITPGSGGTTPPPPAGGFTIQLRMSGLTASQQAIFQQAAARWQQIIIGDLPNANYNGVAVDDLLIDASATTIDGAGGILGQAGPDRFRSGTSIPYHGSMEFDTADLANLQAGGGLIYTVMHEMGHVLGIGTIWSTRGLLTGAGGSNPLFTGAQATAQYNAIFGTHATGVPVENTGGSGTRDAHWRESTFGNELMTGWLNNGVNPLSRVTIASLADLGYQVDISKADNYTGPGGSLLGGSGGNGSGPSLRSTLVSLPTLTDRQAQMLNSLVQQSKTVSLDLVKQSASVQSQQKVTDDWSVQRTVSKPTKTTEFALNESLLAQLATVFVN